MFDELEIGNRRVRVMLIVPLSGFDVMIPVVPLF
jgi:hypothetical protein